MIPSSYYHHVDLGAAVRCAAGMLENVARARSTNVQVEFKANPIANGFLGMRIRSLHATHLKMLSSPSLLVAS